ncbi:uncharacterized protein TNCV_2705151 [Trichonephila clavipes]|nr:uncharacterized protein TNCV_2705151 [Trichonephila clavipes]
MNWRTPAGRWLAWKGFLRRPRPTLGCRANEEGRIYTSRIEIQGVYRNIKLDGVQGKAKKNSVTTIRRRSIPEFQECDEEDVETWMACDAEYCGFQILKDDEIETSVQEADPFDDEMEKDEDNHNTENSKGPSNAETFSQFETAMEWYEQQSECCPTQLLLLRRTRDLAACFFFKHVFRM